MQVLLVVLGLLLYLGIIYLWVKSNYMASKWLLMFVLVILPSLMYYLVHLKSHGLVSNFIRKFARLGFITASQSPPDNQTAMSADDAYKILQLPAGANTAAVYEAHRRLMVRNHPDTGGSAYIAVMLNQARATLTES